MLANPWKKATFALLFATLSMAAYCVTVQQRLATAARAAGSQQKTAQAAPPSFTLFGAASAASTEDEKVALLRRATTVSSLCAAASALGNMRTDSAADLLIAELPKHPASAAGNCLLDAVAAVQTEHGFIVLLPVLKSEKVALREHAMSLAAASPFGVAREAVREIARTGSARDRVRAVLALAQASDPSATELVKPLIGSMSNDNLIEFLTALRSFSQPADLTFVDAFMMHPASQVRGAAIALLGAIDSAEARTRLEQLLDGDDANAAASALVESPEGRAALLVVARSERSSASECALTALTQTSGADIDALMLEKLSSNVSVPGYAGSYIVEHRLTQAMPALLAKAALSEQAAGVAAALAAEMGAEGVSILEQLAAKGGRNAGIALGTLTYMPEGRDSGRRLAIQMLAAGNADAARFLADDSDAEASRALYANAKSAGRAGKAALSVLAERRDAESLQLLSDLARRAGPNQAIALRTLSQRGDSNARSILLDLAKDANPNTRAEALTGLIRKGDMASLRKALTDADPDVRTAALSALDNVGAPSGGAAQLVEQLTADPNESVSRGARARLAMLDPARALAVARRDFATPEKRGRVVEGLESIPLSEKRELLQTALADPKSVQSALDQLASSDDPAAESMIVKVLEGGAGDEARVSAAKALLALGGPYATAHEAELQALSEPASANVDATKPATAEPQGEAAAVQ